MGIDKSKILQAWQTAATDLGLKIKAPFYLQREDGMQCEFIALIESIGSPQGTLICLPDEWDDLRYDGLAEVHGYYCSGLYEIYEQYDRDTFVETLIDWGWYGAMSNQPSWFQELT